MSDRIAKTLSANDTGENGTHQAGILVPRKEDVLSFFPKLDPQQYNPRVHLRFIDGAIAESW
jgi:Restriction endonuclease EcoRII, N-terminal